MIKFEKVEDYYSYKVQSNSFAPSYDKLSESLKEEWKELFKSHKQQVDGMPK